MKKKFLAVPCGMWDLNSPTKDRTRTPCSGIAILTTGSPGKSQNFCASKDNIKKQKDKPLVGRKYLQIIHLIRDLYLIYIKKSYN